MNFERQECSMRSGFSIPLPGKSVQFRRAITNQEGLKNIGQFNQVLSSDDSFGGIRMCRIHDWVRPKNSFQQLNGRRLNIYLNQERSILQARSVPDSPSNTVQAFSI
jgi:hypothetical protein